ncbi:hypothetical protein Q3G72_014567 [Acer saccharum]|nr:hypothetical protein Q3G72_005749 [Acer saccharum]KAK1591844.1 hypothetical protein Q3G72_014567 [Acer saccharum]
MVVASKDKKLANAVQQLLASSHLIISTSSDVTGVEIAGALKNVLAIAAGNNSTFIWQLLSCKVAQRYDGWQQRFIVVSILKKLFPA